MKLRTECKLKRKIELLSPAKNAETGITAINYGADAVYIGAASFGARANACNSLSDIEILINHAHKYNAKIYITMNTVLYEQELKEAEKMIRDIYNIGADALIIQDMGILEMDIPPIPLHLSTQGHNFDLERIKFMDKQGFQRIVLARELSINQIANIRQNINCEIETFVHGAICVCFSGQCYLSANSGGRSGNRGECAQPCRKSYTLIDDSGSIIKRNKNLLSIKDMNQHENLFELIKAGSDSLKIEGRLKDISYVKNITASYRKALDNILEGRCDLIKASSGRVYFDFKPDAEKSFNRKFTNYFLNERDSKIGNFDTPKSMGKKIGVITSKNKNSFEVSTNEYLHNGDGLVFFDKYGKLNGVRVNRVEGKKIFPLSMDNIFEGLEVYRNMDISFEKELETSKTERKIDVNIHFMDVSDGFSISITDEDENNVTHEYKIEKELTKSGTTDENTIKKQLNKLGASIFSAKNINISLTKPYFTPVKILNDIRREAVEKLEAERIKNYKTAEISRKADNTPYPKSEVNYLENITNSLAEKFYEKHGAAVRELGVEVTKETKDKKLMTTKMCIKYELDMCPSFQKPRERWVEPVFLTDGDKKYRLEFDCKNCVMNIFEA